MLTLGALSSGGAAHALWPLGPGRALGASLTAVALGSLGTGGAARARRAGGAAEVDGVADPLALGVDDDVAVHAEVGHVELGARHEARGDQGERHRAQPPPRREIVSAVHRHGDVAALLDGLRRERLDGAQIDPVPALEELDFAVRLGPDGVAPLGAGVQLEDDVDGPFKDLPVFVEEHPLLGDEGRDLGMDRAGPKGSQDHDPQQPARVSPKHTRLPPNGTPTLSRG